MPADQGQRYIHIRPGLVTPPTQEFVDTWMAALSALRKLDPPRNSREAYVCQQYAGVTYVGQWIAGVTDEQPMPPHNRARATRHGIEAMWRAATLAVVRKDTEPDDRNVAAGVALMTGYVLGHESDADLPQRLGARPRPAPRDRDREIWEESGSPSATEVLERLRRIQAERDQNEEDIRRAFRPRV